MSKFDDVGLLVRVNPGGMIVLNTTYGDDFTIFGQEGLNRLTTVSFVYLFR